MSYKETIERGCITRLWWICKDIYELQGNNRTRLYNAVVFAPTTNPEGEAGSRG
jgi:hypothetical protein